MSLVNTLMQPLRTQYSGQLDKNEARPSRYGAWDFFNKDTQNPNGIFDPEVKAKIKQSFGNSVVVPVLDAKDVTIGNVRSCTVADDENTSQLITLTFVTYAFGFTMYPSQSYNNDVKYQADFSRKLNNYLIKMAATLDLACIAKLEADKNQFFPADLTAYYAQAGGALQVSQAEKNDFYNNLQSIMNTMDFYGMPNIISSTSGQGLVRRNVNQGAGNAINEEFQLSPYDWHWTNRIANGAGVQSTLYAVNEGSVAVDFRLDPDALAGARIGDVAEWSQVQVPIPNSPYSIPMGAYYRKDCADASGLQAGTAGLTRTLKESFEWSVDAVYASAYNSDIANRYNPIIKAEISTT